jgi:glutathione S-transferase
MAVPFIRKKSPEDLESQSRLVKVKWQKLSARFEAILRKNGGVYLVGESLSYADILVAHMTTWFVEEVSAILHLVLIFFSLELKQFKTWSWWWRTSVW